METVVRCNGVSSCEDTAQEPHNLACGDPHTSRNLVVGEVAFNTSTASSLPNSQALQPADMALYARQGLCRAGTIDLIQCLWGQGPT